jgi:quaternary ammonium compound-resistance protein SugE
MRALLLNPWTVLVAAGLLEVAWASGFKAAFRQNHLITAAVVVTMIASFAGLNYAMRTIPVGTAYAVWTGIGAAGAALVGVVIFKEPATAIRILSISAIIGGVIGLRLAGGGGH